MTPEFFHLVLFQRVYLDIQVGEHANNYKEIASKDKLSELQLRLRQLNDQVSQIYKEQNYQRVSQPASLGKSYQNFKKLHRMITGFIYIVLRNYPFFGDSFSNLAPSNWQK